MGGEELPENRADLRDRDLVAADGGEETPDGALAGEELLEYRSFSAGGIALPFGQQNSRGRVAPGQLPDAEIEQQTQASAVAELDKSMKTILTPEARSRLASLNLVNPELTTRVKTHLATLANEQRISTPVNDQQLKRILAGLSEGRRETSIRRI